MAKLCFRGLTDSASVSANNGSTFYNPVATTDYFGDSEAPILSKEHKSGVATELFVPVIANTLNQSWIMTLRVNQVDTAMAVTVPSSTTGFFSYSASQVTYVADDQLSLSDYSTANSGSIWPKPVVMIAQPQGMVMKFFSWFFTVNKALTRFYTLNGTNNSTESNAQTNMLFSGVMKYYKVRVSANTLTSTSTFTSRKNAAAGNMSIVVAAGTTGDFEDLSAQDFFVSGDDMCVRQVNAAGGTSIQAAIACNIENFEGKTMTSYVANASMNFNTTRYHAIVGSPAPKATESGVLMYMPRPVKISHFQFRFQSNTVNGTTTVSLRVGQTNIISINVGASTTGWFSDTSSVATAQRENNVSVGQVAAGTSGSQILNIVTTMMDFGDYDLGSFRKDIKLRPRVFAPGLAR